MAAARKKQSSRVKLKRLEAQTRVICTFNRIIFGVMALVLAMAVVASALPQKRHLTEMEDKLQRTLREETKIKAELEYRETEHKAMKDDPEFLKLKARDRLNLREQGEKIYRIKREEE